jgi:hypothetical protein
MPSGESYQVDEHGLSLLLWHIVMVRQFGGEVLQGYSSSGRGCFGP